MRSSLRRTGITSTGSGNERQSTTSVAEDAEQRPKRNGRAPGKARKKPTSVDTQKMCYCGSSGDWSDFRIALSESAKTLSAQSET
jgi:hypothetical protein